MTEISKIQRLVNKNLLQDSDSSYCPTISEIKRCRRVPREYVKTKDRWYNKYSLDEGYEGVKVKDTEDPDTKPDFKVGQIVAAIDAVNFKGKIDGLDIRPKIFDNVTKSWVLLDSGSCVSCQPPGPKDVLDPTFKLKSVNGGLINTYGTKEMILRIGRKTSI